MLKLKTENWKIENWKHCSKIIFKCVNSIMRLIFNEKFIKKWYLWSVNSIQIYCSWLKGQPLLLKKKKKKKWAETRIATHVNVANTDPNRRFETKNVYQNKTKKKKVKKCKNIWEREVCSTLHRSYVLLVFLSASARSIPFSPFFDLPKTVSSCFFTWPLNPRRQCQKTT